jgi:hypothetical protein
MIKKLRKIPFAPILVGLLILFLAEACVSKAPPRRRNGKIPKSGRIPCPIKDC